ncbi:MAG: methionyl-tRNA formyltransferase [Bacteroidetes bacterium]|nr:MAG: methionyl-tRNA formyltransferase [Bacteroidota bacterium]
MQRIVFMGTPEFSVPSLEALIQAGHEIVAVVTPPDKPAGRGQKLRACPVKAYATQRGLTILQPEKLKDPLFIAQIQSLQPDLMVVVAFRMIPEAIWSLPKNGTFNLHSSLLPNYRGAAPMNHAIINGEKKTGVTTFLLNHKIDTGKILFTREIDIPEDMNVGALHDKLMHLGASLVVETAEALEKGTVTPIAQDKLEQESPLHKAPKFTKKDLAINWDRKAHEVYNFIRGLSPYPAAFTHLLSPTGETYLIKIFEASVVTEEAHKKRKNKQVETDGKSFLHIGTHDGMLKVLSLQQAGKKRMNVEAFLKGFRIHNDWMVS